MAKRLRAHDHEVRVFSYPTRASDLDGHADDLRSFLSVIIFKIRDVCVHFPIFAERNYTDEVKNTLIPIYSFCIECLPKQPIEIHCQPRHDLRNLLQH